MLNDEPSTIAAWQRGDEQAVRAVFDGCYPRAVRLAALSGLAHDEAQDCAQEAFLTAFRRREQLRDVKAFPLWFHRILTHAILDTLGARRTDRQTSLDAVGELSEDWQRRRPPLPDEVLLRAERRELLWERVQALPPRYRVPLALRYYGEFSIREVATLLETSEGAMRVTLHRALNALRQQAAPLAAHEHSTPLP